MPLFCWNANSIGKTPKGFGDIMMLDDLTEKCCQENETVVQILCLSPCFIHHKFKVYVEKYTYEIKIEILR